MVHGSTALLAVHRRLVAARARRTGPRVGSLRSAATVTCPSGPSSTMSCVPSSTSRWLLGADGGAELLVAGRRVGHLDERQRSSGPLGVRAAWPGAGCSAAARQPGREQVAEAGEELAQQVLQHLVQRAVAQIRQERPPRPGSRSCRPGIWPGSGSRSSRPRARGGRGRRGRRGPPGSGTVGASTPPACSPGPSASVASSTGHGEADAVAAARRRGDGGVDADDLGARRRRAGRRSCPG